MELEKIIGTKLEVLQMYKKEVLEDIKEKILETKTLIAVIENNMDVVENPITALKELKETEKELVELLKKLNEENERD